MDFVKRIRSVFGPPALLASLLLASPGVEAVRAEEPTQAAAPGASCEAAAQPSADADLQAFLEQVRLQQAAHAARQQSAPVSSDEIVVLNGRGYNYGPPPTPSLDLIRAEAASPRQR